MKSILKSLTAEFTLVAFMITQVILPAPAQAATLTPTEVGIYPAFEVSIPSTLGTVDTLIQSPSLEKEVPTLIHIQTAHGNYEAQKNIQQILHHLHNEYGISTLLIEGSAFKLQPELLRLYPDRMDVTMAIADELTKMARVKGPELFLLEAKEAEGYGIESLDSYVRNGVAFKEVLLQREKTSDFLSDMNMQVERLTSPFLNKNLRSFIKRISDYEEKRLPFEKWLNYLRVQAKEHIDHDLLSPNFQFEWPMLVRIFKLQEFEARMDLRKFTKERKNFLKEFEAVVARNEVTKQSQRSPRSSEARDDASREDYQTIKNFLSSPMTRHQLADPGTQLLFERMAASLPKDFNYEKYPNVNRFIGHLILQSELKADLLMDEIDRLETMIAERLARTETEQRILSLLNDHRILKKLFALELTPADYDKILNRETDLLPQNVLKRFSELDHYGQVREMQFQNVPEITKLYTSALDFYDTVKERDQDMIRNAEARMQELGVKKAAVITGGFHSAPFKNYFSSKEFNYALISPKISSTEGSNVYHESVLHTEPNIFDKQTRETAPSYDPYSIQRLHGADTPDLWNNAADFTQATVRGHFDTRYALSEFNGTVASETLGVKVQRTRRSSDNKIAVGIAIEPRPEGPFNQTRKYTIGLTPEKRMISETRYVLDLTDVQQETTSETRKQADLSPELRKQLQDRLSELDGIEFGDSRRTSATAFIEVINYVLGSRSVDQPLPLTEDDVAFRKKRSSQTLTSEQLTLAQDPVLLLNQSQLSNLYSAASESRVVSSENSSEIQDVQKALNSGLWNSPLWLTALNKHRKLKDDVKKQLSGLLDKLEQAEAGKAKVDVVALSTPVEKAFSNLQSVVFDELAERELLNPAMPELVTEADYEAVGVNRGNDLTPEELAATLAKNVYEVGGLLLGLTDAVVLVDESTSSETRVQDKVVVSTRDGREIHFEFSILQNATLRGRKINVEGLKDRLHRHLAQFAERPDDLSLPSNIVQQVEVGEIGISLLLSSRTQRGTGLAFTVTLSETGFADSNIGSGTLQVLGEMTQSETRKHTNWMAKHGDRFSVDFEKSVSVEAFKRGRDLGVEKFTANPASAGTAAANGELDKYILAIENRKELTAEELLWKVQQARFAEELDKTELSIELDPTVGSLFELELYIDDSGDKPEEKIRVVSEDGKYVVKKEYQDIVGARLVDKDVVLDEATAKAVHDLMVETWVSQALDIYRLHKTNATVKIGNTKALIPHMGEWGRSVGVDVFHIMAILGINRNFTLGFSVEDADQPIEADKVTVAELEAVKDLNLDTATAQGVLSSIASKGTDLLDYVKPSEREERSYGRHGQSYHSDFVSRRDVKVNEEEWRENFSVKARGWYGLVQDLYALITRFNDELDSIDDHGVSLIPASVGVKLDGQPKHLYLYALWGAGRRVTITAPQGVYDSFNKLNLTTQKLTAIRERMAKTKKAYAKDQTLEGAVKALAKHLYQVQQDLAPSLEKQEWFFNSQKDAEKVIEEILTFKDRKPEVYAEINKQLYAEGDKKFHEPQLKGVVAMKKALLASESRAVAQVVSKESIDAGRLWVLFNIAKEKLGDQDLDTRRARQLFDAINVDPEAKPQATPREVEDFIGEFSGKHPGLVTFRSKLSDEELEKYRAGQPEPTTLSSETRKKNYKKVKFEYGDYEVEVEFSKQLRQLDPSKKASNEDYIPYIIPFIINFQFSMYADSYEAMRKAYWKQKQEDGAEVYLVRGQKEGRPNDLRNVDYNLELESKEGVKGLEIRLVSKPLDRGERYEGYARHVYATGTIRSKKKRSETRQIRLSFEKIGLVAKAVVPSGVTLAPAGSDENNEAYLQKILKEAFTSIASLRSPATVNMGVLELINDGITSYTGSQDQGLYRFPDVGLNSHTFVFKPGSADNSRASVRFELLDKKGKFLTAGVLEEDILIANPHRTLEVNLEKLGVTLRGTVLPGVSVPGLEAALEKTLSEKTVTWWNKFSSLVGEDAQRTTLSFNGEEVTFAIQKLDNRGSDRRGFVLFSGDDETVFASGFVGRTYEKEKNIEDFKISSPSTNSVIEGRALGVEGQITRVEEVLKTIAERLSSGQPGTDLVGKVQAVTDRTLFEVTVNGYSYRLEVIFSGGAEDEVLPYVYVVVTEYSSRSDYKDTLAAGFIYNPEDIAFIDERLAALSPQKQRKVGASIFKTPASSETRKIIEELEEVAQIYSNTPEVSDPIGAVVTALRDEATPNGETLAQKLFDVPGEAFRRFVDRQRLIELAKKVRGDEPKVIPSSLLTEETRMFEPTNIKTWYKHSKSQERITAHLSNETLVSIRVNGEKFFHESYDNPTIELGRLIKPEGEEPNYEIVWEKLGAGKLSVKITTLYNSVEQGALTADESTVTASETRSGVALDRLTSTGFRAPSVIGTDGAALDSVSNTQFQNLNTDNAAKVLSEIATEAYLKIARVHTANIYGIRIFSVGRANAARYILELDTGVEPVLVEAVIGLDQVLSRLQQIAGTTEPRKARSTETRRQEIKAFYADLKAENTGKVVDVGHLGVLAKTDPEIFLGVLEEFDLQTQETEGEDRGALQLVVDQRQYSSAEVFWKQLAQALNDGSEKYRKVTSPLLERAKVFTNISLVSSDKKQKTAEVNALVNSESAAVAVLAEALNIQGPAYLLLKRMIKKNKEALPAIYGIILQAATAANGASDVEGVLLKESVVLQLKWVEQAGRKFLQIGAAGNILQTLLANRIVESYA